MEAILNGTWDAGYDRKYDRTVKVPGLFGDPSSIDTAVLWYRRRLTFPDGDWTHATLVLNGARFCPSVYVNGTLVSSSPGGMTVTRHLLGHSAVAPGAHVDLEIALQPLDRVDAGDASKIPKADLWRSNVSSCLWDDVKLRTHGKVWLDRVVPSYSLDSDTVDVRWWLPQNAHDTANMLVRAEVLDADGTTMASAEKKPGGVGGIVSVTLGGACRRWSPEDPALYRLRVSLLDSGRLSDVHDLTLGVREFRVQRLGFELNRAPVTLRAGSVVWHRWVRDPEARELAFDPGWFEENIVKRLKSHGANCLRFHLGMPPERFFDMCDRYGLLVQAEWLFFHGMAASKASLLTQWRDWFDTCLRHPCVVLLHPWNETEGAELETAFSVIDELTPEYAPMVISHRDVIHIHKYWWSLFENVGVYYDSANQFEKPIMADEFGGNYLDGDYNPGKYPSIKESMLRFLGRAHTREQRAQLQVDSHARVAEYWRRIGAAGFSPFCILGSPEDGNHHFEGALAAAKPKPVWDALTAAYSPQSCSLEIWDRNFLPGCHVELPLHLFNDTAGPAVLLSTIRVVSGSEVVEERTVRSHVPAHRQRVEFVTLRLPHTAGELRIEAELSPRPASVDRPVVSSWRIRTLRPVVPDNLRGKTVGVPEAELELHAFLTSAGVRVSGLREQFDIAVCGMETWNDVVDGRFTAEALEAVIASGRPLVLLDIGPRELGQGYLDDGDTGPLQGGMHIENPDSVVVQLFGGVSVGFRRAPEPESCIHPPSPGSPLWHGLHQEATWLWNGYRGGLIVPARDMELSGLNAESFMALWTGRGADREQIGADGYTAFELAGFYAFSRGASDQVKSELRAKVKFLFDDAPALQHSINPNAPIVTHDLSALYKKSLSGTAEGLTPLAICGKSLLRTPVVLVSFGPGKGRLVLSQLLTSGRLAEGYGTSGKYGVRYDAAACQFVLNMMARALE